MEPATATASRVERRTNVVHELTATPKRDELMGQPGYRIPAVAVQEQVLPNNVGRMLVRQEEIAESAERWADMPVTLGHPRKRGQPISGRTQEAINRLGLGRLLDPRVENGQLKVDVFLFDHRLEDLGVESEIVDRVEAGEPIPVSTGFGGSFRRDTGEFQNERYDIVAEWIDPDHFAILLDREGACTTEDGCGLGINVRSTARTRADLAGSGEVSEGTVPEGWPPSLSDYVDALDLEPAGDADSVESVDDLTEDGRSLVARHTLLGEASAESFEDLSFFPVVNPETGEIEEGALRAVISGRGAQADVSDSTLETARGSARQILEDEDLLEEDENMDAENAETLLNRLMDRVENLLGRNQEEELSLDDVRNLVGEHIEERFGGPNVFTWVMELFEDEVVYAVDPEGGEQELFRAPYEVDAEEETVELGEREEVERVVEFVPAENGEVEPVESFLAAPEAGGEFEVENGRVIATNGTAARAASEEEDMEREQLIDALVECDEVPHDREALEDASPERLAFVANAAPIDFEAEDGGKGDGEDPTAANADAGDGEDVPAWAEDLQSSVEELSSEVQNLKQETESVRRDREERKESLRAEIAENSSFEEDELEDKPLAELEKIHDLTVEEPVDFSGIGGPSRNAGVGASEEVGVETRRIMSGSRGEAAIDRTDG